MGNIIGTIVSKISDIVVVIRLTFWLKKCMGRLVWYHLLINVFFGVSTLSINQPIAGKAMIVKAIDKMMWKIRGFKGINTPKTKETWVKRHHLQFFHHNLWLQIARKFQESHPHVGMHSAGIPVFDPHVVR